MNDPTPNARIERHLESLSAVHGAAVALFEKADADLDTIERGIINAVVPNALSLTIRRQGDYDHAGGTSYFTTTGIALHFSDGPSISLPSAEDLDWGLPSEDEDFEAQEGTDFDEAYFDHLGKKLGISGAEARYVTGMALMIAGRIQYEEQELSLIGLAVYAAKEGLFPTDVSQAFLRP